MSLFSPFYFHLLGDCKKPQKAHNSLNFGIFNVVFFGEISPMKKKRLLPGLERRSSKQSKITGKKSIRWRAV
jgi:hypothetical protein